jgi:nucleoside-diphosphate-sugar epimerase
MRCCKLSASLNNTMASLLVIGGSGFFGKSILDAYKRGLLDLWNINRIEVVARKASHLYASNPELIAKSIYFHDLDITNCARLPVADYVMHAAASTDARNYLAKPEEEKKNIQLGTSHFCQLAEQYFKNSKILYISSGAAYGQQLAEMSHIKEDFKFQDLQTLDPGKRDYAAAKRDGEGCIAQLGSKGLDVAIARCFAFVGLYLPRDQHFAIGNYIEDGLQGRPITVKAQHAVYRSYLYADDLVSWLMTLLQKTNPRCPIVNVGSDEAISMGDLAKRVANYFRAQVNISPISSPLIDRYVPSIQKALEFGCKQPRILDDALGTTIAAIVRTNFNS